MAKYLLAYHGGGMPETEAERATSFPCARGGPTDLRPRRVRIRHGASHVRTVHGRTARRPGWHDSRCAMPSCTASRKI